MSSAWRKAENKTGYPYYVNADSGVEQVDHPELACLLDSLQQYSAIKYAAYRAAFKIYELQKRLEVPCVSLSAGVLARHCLSISESSLTLEVCELEAVLTDVYFAVERAGACGDSDTAAQLLLNLLLNLYDPERNTLIRVQSVKVVLIVLSPETSEDKWAALVETCADHNGCVSPRRLAGLLALLARLAEYVGETEAFGQQRVQADVDVCFAKSAGMLGMSTRSVVSWALGAEGSAHALWLAALERVRASHRPAATPLLPQHAQRLCSACGDTLVQVLKFRCTKCFNALVCERCYLYGADLVAALSGHKKTHMLHEVFDGEPISPECLGFMKDFKKFFSCSKYFAAKRNRSRSKPPDAGGVEADSRQDNVDRSRANVANCQGNGGRKVFTSTVGKAAGGGGSTPHAMLQDIITQLESQNKALKDLSGQLDSGASSTDDKLRHKVDAHWGLIATQINRLKILKENLTASREDQIAPAKPTNGDRLQAFDLFSPIPMLQEEKAARGEPRVLSLDSGRYSDESRPSEDSQRLMTVSGDQLRPVPLHATSDSISTVSMNDISTWFGNDGSGNTERVRHSLRAEHKSARCNSLTATEQRFAADVRSVASSNHKMKELNADLDTVLDRLQQILTNNFVLDDSCFDNTQLRETANEMEGLLGTLIRGVEQRATRRRAAAAASAV